MISGIGVGGQHFRLGLLQIFWKMLNSIVTIVSYTRTSSSVWLFSMSHFTWLASLDMYLNSHNFRKPSRLILKCSYEFLKCSKEFECPACGKHRDATSWSFPTEAGDLLGQSRALMHILTWSSPIVHELQWKFWVQWTTIFRRKVCALPGNWTQDLLLSVQLLYHWATRLGQLNKEQLRNMHCFWGDSYPYWGQPITITIHSVFRSARVNSWVCFGQFL